MTKLFVTFFIFASVHLVFFALNKQAFPIYSYRMYLQPPEKQKYFVSLEAFYNNAPTGKRLRSAQIFPNIDEYVLFFLLKSNFKTSISPDQPAPLEKFLADYNLKHSRKICRLDFILNEIQFVHQQPQSQRINVWKSVSTLDCKN